MDCSIAILNFICQPDWANGQPCELMKHHFLIFLRGYFEKSFAVEFIY